MSERINTAELEQRVGEVFDLIHLRTSTRTICRW